jgi:hypothetical protein
VRVRRKAAREREVLAYATIFGAKGSWSHHVRQEKCVVMQNIDKAEAFKHERG